MGLVLALLLVAAPAPAPKVAVLDVRSGPKVDAALSPYLTQVLAAEVASRTGSTPLVRADIQALLGFEKTRRSMGCDDEGGSCIAEVAGALGVDEVVHATLLVSETAGTPDRYLFTATRLDAHKARPIARDAQSVPFGDSAALEHAVRRAAFRLFGGRDPGEPPAPKTPAPAAPAAGASPAPSTGTAAGPPPAAPAAALPVVETTAPPARSSRRTAAWIAGGAALALGAAATGFGFAALTAADAGNADLAHNRAHAADALWVAAAVTAGTSVWLWFSGTTAAVVAAPVPGGATAVATLAF